MLKFANQIIPGTTESYVKPSPMLHARRVKYWDVIGEAEIVGLAGGRPILVTHLLHDELATPAALERALVKLDRLVGRHGVLHHSGEATGQTFTIDDEFVTFEGSELLPLPGQEHPSAVKDIAGTLTDDSGNADNGWCQYLLLRFYQLLPPA